MPNCGICKQKFPNRVKIKDVVRTISNRRFCLECSPFGEHNTKDLTKSHVVAKRKECVRCGEKKTADLFYKRSRDGSLHAYCIACDNSDSIHRHRELKRKCVAYKVGACYRCGYNKCMSALQFHHRDPSKKDFIVSTARSKNFDFVKSELDKCDLVCANCHAEIHAELNGSYNELECGRSDSNRESPD